MYKYRGERETNEIHWHNDLRILNIHIMFRYSI